MCVLEREAVAAQVVVRRVRGELVLRGPAFVPASPTKETGRVDSGKGNVVTTAASVGGCVGWLRRRGLVLSIAAAAGP